MVTISSRFIPATRCLGLFFLCILLGCGGGGGGGSDVALSTDACGTLGLKIFSGTTCTPDSTAPVVSIEIDTLDGRTELCSGTLISPRHVLTAGHCFPGQGSNTKQLRVNVGGEVVAASNFAIHPGYSERSDLAAIFNDVAIIELSKNAAVAPLPLLLSRQSTTGDVIDIFGYGLTEIGGLGQLRSGQMLLSNVTTTHLFAEFGGAGSNTCLGDSGGPALAANVQGQIGIVGTTSTGTPDSNCRRGDLSLFINIQDSSISDFISSVVPNVGVI